MNRSGTSWQLILADLALILFLVSLIALIGGQEERAAKAREHKETGAGQLAPTSSQMSPAQISRSQVAPAHAIYRSSANGPPIRQWLADQALDNRAVLTIHARHVKGEEGAAWISARALAREAQGTAVRVRVTIEEAQERDLSATLAFDAAP